MAAVAGRAPQPFAAYTIDVANGAVNAHPATASTGSDVMTLAADDLPYPIGSPKRLVVIGVTTNEAVLVVDLGEIRAIAVNADRPDIVARAWVLQLLLNSEISLTTNCAGLSVSGSRRIRQSFMPGVATELVNVDDKRPPITTVSLNPPTDGPDHLEVDQDGTGELYLGARFWSLRQVMTVSDAVWKSLVEQLESADAPTAPEPVPNTDPTPDEQPEEQTDDRYVPQRP
ncbi:hypothetical protein [Nocardia sp. NPDC057030]|uniref:hypothetical protein n=1 Tax=unclassified Nocardia TaxID=2637762 RepID=UPI00363263C5